MSLDSAIQHLLNAKRITAPTQSYAKDNPSEATKVFAYLNGGTRPSGVTTEMGVGLLEVEDARRQVPPNPPDPPPVSGPITISAGGTYTGNWKSTTAQPAVTISTNQPVIIEGSFIENTDAGINSHLLSQAGSAAQVTVRSTKFTGPVNGYGRAIRGENFKSWLIENCDFTRTGGIYFLIPGAAPSVIVRRNKARNIQGQDSSALRQFLQLNGVQGGAGLAEWNEIINTFGQSVTEDIFSVFNSSNIEIRNNYVEGGYPVSATARHRGTGILLADVNGNNNSAHGNHIVGVTNLGIGITAGVNNHIYDNRVISDGKLPDGTPLTGANNGIVCWNAYGTSMSNNTVYDNYIGAMHSGSPMYRNDFWCPAANNNVETANTYAYGNHSTPITNADELAERPIWNAKVAAAGVTIGV
jgi:hypothetical protein